MKLVIGNIQIMLFNPRSRPESIEDCRATVSANPSGIMARIRLFNALADAGLSDQAISEGAHALGLLKERVTEGRPPDVEELSPGMVQFLHFHLGQLLAAQGKRAEAVQHLESALRSDGGPWIRRRAAKLRDQLGR